MKIKIWNFLYDHRNLLVNICVWGGGLAFYGSVPYIFGETIDGIGELVILTIAGLIFSFYFWAIQFFWPGYRK